MLRFIDLVHFDVRQPRTGFLVVRVVFCHYADGEYGGDYVYMLVNQGVPRRIVDIVRVGPGADVCLFHAVSQSVLNNVDRPQLVCYRYVTYM